MRLPGCQHISGPVAEVFARPAWLPERVTVRATTPAFFAGETLTWSAQRGAYIGPRPDFVALGSQVAAHWGRIYQAAPRMADQMELATA